MARRRFSQLLVTAVDAATGDAHRRPDQLLVEEPLTIQLDPTRGLGGGAAVTVATTMRTPGHDFELAVGFCHSEGLLGQATVRNVRYCAQGAASDSAFNVVAVTAPGAPPPVARVGTTTSSCGLCGNEAIDALVERLTPMQPVDPPPLAVLAGLPDSVRSAQDLFASTGAAHAAATFTADGTIGLVREDAGRHNAVDKIVGRLLLDGELPARTGAMLGLFVSGRASFELATKAWSAGFCWMLAVSAPTELAVLTARRGGLFLAGFVRGTHLNVYSPDRPSLG